METRVTMNSMSCAYIGITITWTVILYSAMGILWHHRQLPQLQMRRLSLVFVAVTVLHIYWILCMLGNVIGPVVPCAVEYWMMSILLPSGIALFQIANSQLLRIACGQRCFRDLFTLNNTVLRKHVPALRGQTISLRQRLSKRFNHVDPITRLIMFVGMGMIIQVRCLSVLQIIVNKRRLFLLFSSSCYRRNSTPLLVFSLRTSLVATQISEYSAAADGSGTHMPPARISYHADTLTRWPSIIWQFFWAWLYGPYILWKARNIQDTHGWRIQTIVCCIAGLPSTPLWLCGLYLPQFAPVNAVFGPTNWFAVSIFLIESCFVLIPCCQIQRHYRLRKQTLHAVANWDTKHELQSTQIVDDDDDATQVDLSSNRSYAVRDDAEKGLYSVSTSRSSTCSFKKSHFYTMVALEWALVWNPGPLQEFAALKDFSGENIAFLVHLANWKKVWSRKDPTTPSLSTSSRRQNSGEVTGSGDILREAYNCAMSLYCILISSEHAEFPINLCGSTLRRLDTVFAQPAKVLFGDTSSQSTVNCAAPFAADRSKPVTMTDIEEVRDEDVAPGLLRLQGMYYWGDIPAEFAPDCFDEAESEVKYLVLTNTWPRFVQAGHAEDINDPQGRTLGKRLAQHFFREMCK